MTSSQHYTYGVVILESKDIAIVLTGTITPNTTLANKHLDPQARRKEYLNAIDFYRQFGTVYFLENSIYLLGDDPEFQDIPNVLIRKFPVSNFPEKGKGFQEFEMIDAWINSEVDLPLRWIKVTGRYIYQDFAKIRQECDKNISIDMMINQYLFSQWADVAIFCIKTDYYQQYILGIYNQCDDRSRILIERVMYNQLTKSSKNNIRRFHTYLKCLGIAGSTGKEINNSWTNLINSNIIRWNYLIDQRYIWLSF